MLQLLVWEYSSLRPSPTGSNVKATTLLRVEHYHINQHIAEWEAAEGRNYIGVHIHTLRLKTCSSTLYQQQIYAYDVTLPTQ